MATQAQTTTESITTEQIEALRNEAANAGDEAMVAICEAALNGDANAERECVEAINAAKAMN